MSKIFIGIDAQRDFIDGALPNTEAQNNVVLLNQASIDARNNEFDVIWTQDTHGVDYLKTLEGEKLPVPHCVIGTPGWDLHPAIEAEASDNTYDKPTFGSLDLLNDLMLDNDAEPIEVIVMAGYCTNICGVSNALLLRAGLPNTHIYWLAFASAATSYEDQVAALRVMRSCQIDVIETYSEYKELLKKLD